MSWRTRRDRAVPDVCHGARGVAEPLPALLEAVPRAPQVAVGADAGHEAVDERPQRVERVCGGAERLGRAEPRQRAARRVSGDDPGSGDLHVGTDCTMVLGLRTGGPCRGPARVSRLRLQRRRVDARETDRTATGRSDPWARGVRTAGRAAHAGHGGYPA